MENTRRQGRPALGLPVLALVGLALLAAPRVVLHDLDLIQEGTVVNALFVFVPPLVWIAVAVLRRVPNPFLTVLVIGAIYGVLLAVGHQLLWHVSFPDGTPRLGGNLGDVPPATSEVVVRGFAAVGSVFTGVLVGAVSGLVAWGVGKLRR
ncbi:hypothetical protein [Pseudonocardia kunmingensis]|uniref:Uncharacterized protein n=1 Tax=Pseudonocardia kunmingensis TaxID=630975 RepID=A0A543DRM5_9PSEU|nr:hypothetical protein [Pseudonocardia kunmingensis]TQM11978.1 hypothetical protein FB558_4551 [Pseudonocardia kunmingensis]